jgi:hypothetical protein
MVIVPLLCHRTQTAKWAEVAYLNNTVPIQLTLKRDSQVLRVA